MQETMLMEMLETMHGFTTVEGLVSAVLQKLVFCPFCDKDRYFINHYDLRIHIRDDHSEKLISSVKKRVERHEVDENAKIIYICPDCHFAVGNEHRDPNPTTVITAHTHKFYFSDDKELIQAYIKGTVEIELFCCPICTFTSRVSETLLEHLTFKHSYFDQKKISDETLNLVKNVVNIFIEKNQSKEPQKSGAPLKQGIEEGLKPPVRVPKPTPPIFSGQKFSKTAQSNEIYKGVISFPPRLKAVFNFTEQIKVKFHLDHEKILPYDKSKGLSGLKDWYLINAVEPGDKILFCLLNQNPANIKIWTEWEKTSELYY